MASPRAGGDRSLVYRLYGQDVTAGKTLERVARKGQAVDSGFRKMAGSLGAFLGGAAILKFGKDSVKAFTESQAATARLDAALAKNAKTAHLNAAAFADMNEARAKTTRFDDDASASAAAVLAQYRLTEDQIRTLLPYVQDYAAKTGKDLTTAAKVAGKAIMGKGRALAEVGVRFKDAGSEGANFDQVVRGLRQQVGGFAEKEGRTAAGQAEILENQFGEIQEKVGEDLLPVLMDLGKGLHAALNFADENSGTVKAVALVGGGLWGINKALKVGKAIGDSTLITLGKRIVGTRVLTRETERLAKAQVAEAGAANLPRQGGGGVPPVVGGAGKFNPLRVPGVGGGTLPFGAGLGVGMGSLLDPTAEPWRSENERLYARMQQGRAARATAAKPRPPAPPPLSASITESALRDSGYVSDLTKAADATARLRKEADRQAMAHLKVKQAAGGHARAMDMMREAEVAAIEPKTRLLKISDKQQTAYRKEVAAIRESYNAFDEAPKRAGLSVAELQKRMQANLRYQSGLAGATQQLVAKGVSGPMLAELQELEKSAPGTMEQVAKTATPAFVAQMKADMSRLTQTAQVIADPLIAAANLAGKSAGQTGADAFLRAFGYHVSKGAGPVLPGDVRASERPARRGSSDGAPAGSPTQRTGRETGVTAMRLDRDDLDYLARRVAGASNFGMGGAAVNMGRVG